MPDTTRRIAICGNRYQQGHLRLLSRMLRLLSDSGFTLDIHADFYDYLHETGIDFPAGTRKATSLIPSAEAVVSVGGDGTFLHTAAWVGDTGIPIIGINTGHLGYLAHFAVDDMDEVATALRDRTLRIEQRSMLTVRVDDALLDAPTTLNALNEVAVLKDDTSSMISVSTWIDGDFLAEYSGDGLIFSTATGSTGYNMSAGGPLMQSGLDALLITPVAPHSLTLRPLVVSGNSRLTACTRTRVGRYRVSIDGRSFTLPADSTVEISRAPFRLNVLVRQGSNFAETLRRKLGWAYRTN